MTQTEEKIHSSVAALAAFLGFGSADEPAQETVLDLKLYQEVLGEFPLANAVLAKAALGILTPEEARRHLASIRQDIVDRYLARLKERA